MCNVSIYADIHLMYNTGEVINMAVSKAQQKAVNKYMATNYDRINLTVPKGRKEAIQAVASERGESLNGFVTTAIDERIERLQGKTEGGE